MVSEEQLSKPTPNYESILLKMEAPTGGEPPAKKARVEDAAGIVAPSEAAVATVGITLPTFNSNLASSAFTPSHTLPSVLQGGSANTEEACGILCYVSDTPGFRGILKQVRTWLIAARASRLARVLLLCVQRQPLGVPCVCAQGEGA
jgi:hypothetical protein